LDPVTHDAVTRVPGSLAEALKGIDNILRLRSVGQSLEVRVVVHRLNYRSAPETAAGLLERFGGLDRLVVVFAEYEGRARRCLPTIALSYREFRPVFSEILARLPGTRPVSFYHFPRCVAPRAAWSRIPRTQPREEIGFVPACLQCSQRSECAGIHRAYLEIFGPDEFHPIPQRGAG